METGDRLGKEAWSGYASGMQERRAALRARVSGVLGTYDRAGERIEAEVLDLGRGGVFVATTKPVSIGKRLSLEIRFAEGATWGAVGRVVWTRDATSAGGPPGMGVKLIDVEDAAMEAIDRMVAVRGRSEQRAAPVAPIVSVAPREKTVLGVGGPLFASGATRERSIQEPPPEEGWDLPETPAVRDGSGTIEASFEPSVALALVAKKPAAATSTSEPPPLAEPKRSRRRRRWPVVMAFLAMAGIGVAAMRAHIPWARVQSVVAVVAPPPAPPAFATPIAPLLSAPIANSAGTEMPPPLFSSSPTTAPGTNSARAAVSIGVASASASASQPTKKATATRQTPVRNASKGASNDNPY
jgi:uncharacterized protein (TIGR02266 family)